MPAKFPDDLEDRDEPLLVCSRCGDRFEPEVEIHPDDALCPECVEELEDDEYNDPDAEEDEEDEDEDNEYDSGL